METMQIQLEVEMEGKLAEAYRQVSPDTQAQLKQDMALWLKQRLQSMEHEPPVDDAWLEFLDNLDKHAVDLGCDDFSINHEHYLYGGPKRS